MSFEIIEKRWFRMKRKTRINQDAKTAVKKLVKGGFGLIKTLTDITNFN